MTNKFFLIIKQNMPITFLQIAEKSLSAANTPLSIDDVWQKALDLGLDRELRSVGLTPKATLGARLYGEIKYNSNSIFGATGDRPKQFFLKAATSQQASTASISVIAASVVKPKKKEFNYVEKDLHPFLAYFAKLHLSAHLKTLNHSKSSKKEFGEWVHPDIVGCYFPFTDWKPEVAALNAQISSTAIKLFSFELKRELNFTNLRESFFQAVSNSSWAHEGYLASANIMQDPEFRQELERLSASFGIGVIEINTEDADATAVVYAAKNKDFLDWDGINKLCMNPDFSDFLKRTHNDLSTKDVRIEFYDAVLDKDALEQSIQST